MPLPNFYINNSDVIHSNTNIVRGNTISDLYGENTIGIQISGCKTLRTKNNKTLRIRATNNSIGFKIDSCNDAVLVYSTASRCDQGFVFTNISTLNVYNLTSHNCSQHVHTSSTGIFKNIALSAYKDHKTYKNCIGFFSFPGISLTVDYMYYYNIGTLYSGGTQLLGDNIKEEKILYIDEQNDNLTPDPISILVNTGTNNPLLEINNSDVGGIESEVTNIMTTTNKKYHYDLLDNSFWDIDNNESAEVSFIKAFQSRILANSELATRTVERNTYIKTADSVLRFSELYPMYERYSNKNKFNKRVMDLWLACQKPSTIFAYSNAIGGYNLFPSFFKRLEDIQDSWIIAASDIAYDNWLLGSEGQKYGIMIDVLGLSTLSQAVSAECYNNVQKCISDIAPIYWNLHNEPQPENYLLFTDLYNNFERCSLTNMIYNDDSNLCPNIPGNCQLITPLISTETLSASGNTEISVLDRINSDTVTRLLYYRQGNSSFDMGAWIKIDTPIGGIINLTFNYLQFKIIASDILRRIDYEFIGLCLRPYSSTRDWTLEAGSFEDYSYIELIARKYLDANFVYPTESLYGLIYENDGITATAKWTKYVPENLRTKNPLTLRLLFLAQNSGTATIQLIFGAIDEINKTKLVSSIYKNVTIPIPPVPPIFGLYGLGYVDIELSNYINSNTTLLEISIIRNSSIETDTLNCNLIFINGRAS